MIVNIRSQQNVTIVELHGDLDGNTAPAAQAQILVLAEPDSRIILDMSGVPYMSSAGLRLLLLTYRTINGKGGKVALAGLSEELRETMSVTGFLGFFGDFATVEAGIAGLG